MLTDFQTLQLQYRIDQWKAIIERSVNHASLRGQTECVFWTPSHSLDPIDIDALAIIKDELEQLGYILSTKENKLYIKWENF